ncbi:mitogen-activated protein kinase kinase kinase 14 isoform X2 [Nelusetta ayraudi]
MAVCKRPFNSTSPFCGLSKGELKGSYPSCSADQETEEDEEEEEGKDSKMSYMALLPNIKKFMTHGTAEQVGEMPLKLSYFIAQPEGETPSSYSPSISNNFIGSPHSMTGRYDFIAVATLLPNPCPTQNCHSPSISRFSFSSEHNNVACPTTACVQGVRPVPRKKTRRRQKRKGKKKVVERRKEKQRPRQRMPSGVPEQESGCSPIQVASPLEDRCSLGSSCIGGPSLPRPQTFASDFTPRYDEQDSDLDSCSSNLNGVSLAMAGLHGSVSQGDRCYAGPFAKDMEREYERDEREKGDDASSADSVINEGLLLDDGVCPNMKPVNSEYKAGCEFSLVEHIKEGSFGEVYRAQDVKTGFQFAAKKIPLKRFSSEEVGAWSALRSPRVVEFFGVVREGPDVFLFMDLKFGSLRMLIATRGRLPEDQSLHYQAQVLQALEYLAKKKVAHLDIKADNVLLSEDGRDTFLCDFGHAEKLDKLGQSLSRSRELKGSETHMAPEIVNGDPRGAKADVWSSCCMFLHMLNGCQPWTRYYTCRLYLKIANEPPPLREIPPDCGPLTAEVLRAGLQKDPGKRASASVLKEKTIKALKEVGGLSSPLRGPYAEPLYFAEKPPDYPPLNHCGLDYDEEQRNPARPGITAATDSKKLGSHCEETEAEESKPSSPCCPQISEPNHKRSNKTSTVPELELRKLERDFYLTSLSQLHSAEMQEQLLSCLSSDPYSNWEPWDKKDSGRWSLSPGDDFSSGVYSSNSQPDVQVFSVDLLSHSQLPPPCCFEGVDVCIRDFNWRSIHIRETRRVKVGHIATGISDQISERVFTLETLQGRQVAHDEEVHQSGLDLHCVSAPDFSSAWRWRIRDGVLETR